jgi:Cysteine-rich secretory protein family
MRLFVLMLAIGCGGGSGSAMVDGGGGGGGGGSGSGGGGGGSGSNTALVECVTQTNAYRAMNGKSALTESSQLETYAATGAMFDYENMMAHDHFTMTSGGGIAFAENECPQQGNWMLQPGGNMTALVIQCVDAFYAEGPGGGHYTNMMNASYTTLGCGIYQQGTGVTIVQDYGM